MKKLFLFIFALFFAGCGDAVLPDLPEMDESMDVDSFDMNDDEAVSDEDAEESNSDETADPDEDPDAEPEPETKDSFIVFATVKGYDVPFSGQLFAAKEENFGNFGEIAVEKGMGSASGSDLNVGVWEGGIGAIGRNDSSVLYLFDETEESFAFSREIAIGQESTFNLQDVVYSPQSDEIFVSALNSNRLFVIKNNELSELEISDDPQASPAKMRIIGNRLFVVLQNLNDQWKSEKGEIAVVDLDDHSVKRFDLPAKNPTGKIEYNAAADKQHFYITASGNWQKRDGALIRVDIESHKTEVMLRESMEENNLLDGDFVDASLADNGDFYIIFSNNSGSWTNELLKYEPKEGKLSKVCGNVNAFAANPIDYSPATGRIYYFVDDKADTYLKYLNVYDLSSESFLLPGGPAAVRVKTK